MTTADPEGFAQTSFTPRLSDEDRARVIAALAGTAFNPSGAIRFRSVVDFEGWLQAAKADTVGEWMKARFG